MSDLPEDAFRATSGKLGQLIYENPSAGVDPELRFFLELAFRPFEWEGETHGEPLTVSSPAQPNSDYGRYKLAAEDLVRDHPANASMATYVLRLPMVYGPNAEGNFALLRKVTRLGLPLPVAADRLSMRWFSSWYRALWRADDKEDAETVLLALAQAVHGIEADDEHEFEWVFRDSIEALIRRNDVDRATEYLQYVKHPDSLAERLSRRSSCAPRWRTPQWATLCYSMLTRWLPRDGSRVLQPPPKCARASRPLRHFRTMRPFVRFPNPLSTMTFPKA